MLGKLIAAQMSLENAVAELARTGASTAAADPQISVLATLQMSIGSASAPALAAMRGEVATAVAQSKAIADQARTEANAANAAASLAEAANASRSAVSSAMESLRHIPLSFASREDEAAYRNRENERARYIAEQNAKGTPVGNLNASGAAVGQMVDAKAHGAHGPEFDKQWANLVATTEKLREQVRASGGSTKEFDDRLRNDLRQIMKAKGLTDAEIDARFAANPDPLEAAKAYVQGEDLQKVRQAATNAKDQGWASTNVSQTADAPTTDHVVSAAALLKASGVRTSTTSDVSTPDHGVAVALTSRASGTQLG